MINVKEFIDKNYTPYYGDDSFLAGPTERTTELWKKVLELTKKENQTGPIVDDEVIASITSHGPGYIDENLEVIVGLQADEPLKRTMMPFGGIRMVKKSVELYGKKLDKNVEEFFTKYRKTHNDGVFDAYTQDIRNARTTGLITGLPDAYGRGRIIGDYRRVALYGVDTLIAEKIKEKDSITTINEETIRLREELSEQIKALKELKELGNIYGFDISRPAENAKEAVQWVYLGYLAAVKEQNGAAMSLGRVSTFLDIYIENDIKKGILTESEAQELVDQFIIKLRIVRFLRTKEYDELFSGDPVWVTESIGGMNNNGETLVTKTSYRFLNTLYNLGPAPEPNLTVLWSEKLPQNFKDFCAKVSIDTSSIQYENDDLMRPKFGDDYGIACCVSAMKIGKQMQFFGARANLAKALLYAINGGVDEKKPVHVVPGIEPITDEILDYDKVLQNYNKVMDWLAKTYVDALNIIHYMHDKYNYEKLEMALHDKDVERILATGIAGLSVVADSLSAIKHAKVRPIRNEEGIAVDFEIEGDFPKYGNDDDRVDNIAIKIVETIMNKIRQQTPYRNAKFSQSILTITSNVVYGKKTGSTPDGRKAGEPFAPGANPMHNRDTNGALASCLSVAKIPYDDCEDGISYTFSIEPNSLGKERETRINNLTSLLDGYFKNDGHHININVLNRDTLLDAVEHPELYPQLTVRVSGYAVNFVKLTREQQLEVISRTFHKKM
ncbi:MAG: formate C-acetyltransferase [Clostridiales bacterium]|nr:formate C-acetyltransferase [Clostridiales bacterium]